MGDEGMAGKFGILELLDRAAGGVAENARAAPVTPAPAKAEPEVGPPGLDDHPPLPAAGDAYRAYSRLSSRPVPSLFFLPKTMLPSGFLYHGLERVWMEGGERPGAAPRLIARFSGSEVTEVVMEGRNLLPLCLGLGRMAVAWVWALPANQAAEDDAATVVRSIAFRRVQG